MVAEQFPEMHRCALHGIGKPLLDPGAAAHDRVSQGTRGRSAVQFEQGAFLTPTCAALAPGRSTSSVARINGARPETHAHTRGANLLHKVVEGLTGLAETKERLGLATPQVSIWYVATRENIAELPELVRLAARVGVPEVYLQRMVFFAGDTAEQYGMARHDLAIFDSALSRQEAVIAECEALSAELGITCTPPAPVTCATAWPRSVRPRAHRRTPACGPGQRRTSRPTATVCRAVSRRSLPPTTTACSWATCSHDPLPRSGMIHVPHVSHAAAEHRAKSHRTTSCGVMWSL